MKNKELFEKTISILVEAYLNGTLVKGNCQACAVGNIVAGNNDWNYITEDLVEEDFHWDCVPHIDMIMGDWDIEEIKYSYAQWYNVFGTFSQKPFTKPENYIGGAKEQIDSTGYTWQELAEIEKAFEQSVDMYSGLMNVVEVLGEIHQVDEKIIEENKLMFVK